MELRININDTIIKLIALLAIFTISPISVFVNRIIAMALICLMLIDFFKSSKTFFNVYILFLYFSSLILMLLNSNFSMNNFQDEIYFLFWGLFLVYLSNNINEWKDIIKRNDSFLFKSVIFWSILLLFSMIFPSNYTVVGFASFSGLPHRMNSSALLIYSISHSIPHFFQNKLMKIVQFLPMLSVFLGGARTYLAVFLIIFFTIEYIKSRGHLSAPIKFLMSLVILYFIIINTNIGTKITESFNSEGYYGTALQKFTGSRSVFFVADINAFKEGNIISKLFGYGVDYVYNVNLIAVNAYIYAHNDFINILLSNGFLGIMLYSYSIIAYFYQIKKKLKLKGILLLSIIIIWFFNANFNMVYTYTCAVLAFPFLAESYRLLDSKSD